VLSTAVSSWSMKTQRYRKLMTVTNLRTFIRKVNPRGTAVTVPVTFAAALAECRALPYTDLMRMGKVNRGCFLMGVAACFACSRPALSIDWRCGPWLDSSPAPGRARSLGEDDPELVRDALPFALKIYESLLAEDPENAPLALSTGAPS